MSQVAKSDFRIDRVTGQDAAVRRARIVGPCVAIIAAIVIVVVMIAESRLTPEQRLEMFEASHPYP